MLCQPANRSLKLLAPAKLNLFLRVIRRRPDGFHDLETVMTAINLFDTLVFEPTESGELDLRVIMAPSRNDLTAQADPIPTGSDNLVLCAARLLKTRAGIDHGARITLIKRIPSAAGLGGGSSDAAVTLAGLNRLWQLRYSQTELLEMAATLGSDIGFFLGNSSCCVCRGRGELVEPLRIPKNLHFVVARPATGLSTPQVFKHCRPDDATPSVSEFIQAFRRPGLQSMVRLLHNDLQSPAESLNHDVKNLRIQFEKLPVLAHQMSGSGTSYFGICASSRHARWTAARLRASGVPFVFVARSCS